MERVGAVVDRQRVFLTVNREFTRLNAVAVTTNEGAKERTNLLVFFHRREIARHVREIAVLVRNVHFIENAAEIKDFGGEPVGVFKGVSGYGFAFLRLAKIFRGY